MGTLSSLNILIVEDNESVRNAISCLLRKSKYSVEAVNSGEAALDKLQQRYFDLVISDYKMAQMDGLELLKATKKRWPATQFIIITAFGTISRGVEAMKLGAFDYITKPFYNEELLRIVERLVEKRKSSQQSGDLWREIRSQAEFDSIIARSEKMHELLDLVSRLARKTSTILISGESGTGKELIAKSLHALSNRKDKPFIAINCGAIPQSLQESELFGHVKGAFTGANADKKGLFEAAAGGTVFLDEIAEMAPATQVMLLRCLQEKEIRRVGDSSTRIVDVRLIVATNKNLEDEIAKGKFREDLYYRINVIPLPLPALRRRKEDIPLLVEHFIKKYGDRDNSRVRKISDRALSMLMNYDWPGNVRELENIIHRGVALAWTEEITPDLLPPTVRGDLAATLVGRAAGSGNLAEIEKCIIQETLRRMNGNKRRTAKELGISKATLWRKLKSANE